MDVFKDKGIAFCNVKNGEPIVLDADDEAPENRTGFRYSNLTDHVLRERLPW